MTQLGRAKGRGLRAKGRNRGIQRSFPEGVNAVVCDDALLLGFVRHNLRCGMAKPGVPEFPAFAGMTSQHAQKRMTQLDD